MRSYCLFLFASYLFIAFSSCKKDPIDTQPDAGPSVSTLHFEAGPTPLEGTLYGEIRGLPANGSVENYGHIWALTSDPLPSLENKIGQTFFDARGNGVFFSPITGLAFGTTYYYRAYIIYEGQLIYSNDVQQFTTESLSPGLAIDTIIPTPDDEYTVRVLVTLSNLNAGIPLQSFGITWGSHQLPEITSDPFVPEQGVPAPNTTFQFETEATLPLGDSYLRPFLIVNEDTLYGESRLYHIGNIWSPTANVGGVGRVYAVSFSIGSKGYFGTGNHGNQKLKDFWEYDPQTDSWAQKADFGGGERTAAVGFSIGQKGYIGTGSGTGGRQTDLWEYSPETDSWVQKADVPGAARQNAVGFSIGPKGYIGTGSYFDGGIISTNDFWEYDPIPDVWTQWTDFGGSERSIAVGFSIGQKGYLGTGSGENQRFNDFWEYDPQTDSWAQKADFGGGPRTGAVGFSIGQKGYVGTGSDEIQRKMDVWEYDPSSDSWIQKADFAGGQRTTATAFTIGQSAYIGTGWDGGQGRNDFWEYVP